jgi:hypothetical protein
MSSKNQTKILRALEKTSAYVLKTIQTNRNGVPDILVCQPVEITPDMVGQTLGVFCGIEMKQIGETVSRLQVKHIQQIEEAGGRSGVAYNLDDAKRIIDG